MPYQVLAHKYRPRTFDEVAGQETVTRTLANSITAGRLPNAYIFCGPRGVGKTSVARLVSKTLNCEKAPRKSPCNECVSCREITQGSSIDVLEIDGASNNSVDQVRTLRENVKFSPSRGKFKIYIIDEVHMLSQGAFNALLKTLEEPPEHVKFIFATTEPHRVPATVISRCQRFDFKRIPAKVMYERIMDIAKEEKVRIDEKAALLIARSADGSLRDSLVVLDQMISFSEGRKIAPDDVIELLGMVHGDDMLELSGAVIGNDAKRALSALDRMITGGKDPVFIANSLIKHFRDLMVLRTAGSSTSDMAFTEDETERLKGQLEKLSLEEILYILQNLSHCITLMKGASFARAPLELALIRVSKRGEALALTDILVKLENMKNRHYTKGDALTEAEKAVPDGFVSGPTRAGSAGQGVPVGRERQGGGSSGIEAGSDEPSDGESEASGFNWNAVLNYIKKKKMSVFTFLSAAKPVEFSENKVVIGFGRDHAFNKEALETDSNKKIIEEALNKISGSSPQVEFTLLEFLGEAPEKGVDEKKKELKAKEEMKPVIEKAMDVFGGHVVRDLKEEKE